MKGEMRAGPGGPSSLPALLSTRLPHQVEEDIPEVSPIVIGLSSVGPRRAHHVSEDPFVDVEILEVEGEGELSERNTTTRESQGKWGQRGKLGWKWHVEELWDTAGESAVFQGRERRGRKHPVLPNWCSVGMGRCVTVNAQSQC